MPGPVPPYNNPPINAEFYQPSRFVISAITLGETTLVTTNVDNNYVVGQEIKLLIPQQYGAFQLNNKTGYVVDQPSPSQLEINIYSSGGDAFIPSPPQQSQNLSQPQILAIGDIANGAINANGRANQGTYIPGSFLNISPA